MNIEFKKALIPYVTEVGEKEFEPYCLVNLPNWPMIEVMDPFEEGESFDECLDTENVEIVSFSDTTLEIVCGGDWQEPHRVLITFEDGELDVKVLGTIEEDDMDEIAANSISYIAFEIILFEGVEREEPIKRVRKGRGQLHEINKTIEKTIEQLEKDMFKAVEVEDYEKAAKLRDFIKEKRGKLKD